MCSGAEQKTISDFESFSTSPFRSRTPSCTSMPQRRKWVTTRGVWSSRSDREQKGRAVSSAYSESGTVNSSPRAVGRLPVIWKSRAERNVGSSYDDDDLHVSMTAAMKKVKSIGPSKSPQLLDSYNRLDCLEDAVHVKLHQHLPMHCSTSSETSLGGTPYRSVEYKILFDPGVLGRDSRQAGYH